MLLVGATSSSAASRTGSLLTEMGGAIVLALETAEGEASGLALRLVYWTITPDVGGEVTTPDVVSVVRT